MAQTFTWELVAEGAEGPGLRSRQCFGACASVAVLFGGLTWHDGLWHSDTWELRRTGWRRTVTTTTPPPRQRGAMAVDPGRGYAVVFGGEDDSCVLLSDTWIYENRHWRNVRAWWSRPPGRCGHGLAFDETIGKAVLFGGVGPSDRSLGDTWLFDGNRWEQVIGPAPPPRRYAAFAYDPTLDGCLLHGGSDDERGERSFGDAWLFREGEWTRLPRTFETDPRDDHALAYHELAGRLVMLEGINARRGVLGGSPGGWQPVEVMPLHPRHQCAPMAWHEALGGLVLHGGEAHHAGAQSSRTLVLRLDEEQG